MDENFKHAVKDCLIPILSRFTNGITDLKIEVEKDCHGREYYFVESNDIPMTPCVFKTLCIQGECYEKKDENGNKRIGCNFHWKWYHFDGGENEAKFISILIRENRNSGKFYVDQTYIR